MRLDFNILWVEDQPKRVNAQRERIEMLMRKHGFKLQTKMATSIKEATKYIGDDIYGDHIDLILMDYDFGGEPNGEAGLEMVRNKFPYKDIVFYSAHAQRDLAEFVAQNKIPSVFCCNRNDLPDTVIHVFEVLVKKVLDIDHSRGIVMGATSEIDEFVNESLICVLEKADKDTVATAFNIIEDHLNKIKEQFNKDWTRISETKGISEIIKIHNVYSSAYRLRLFMEILKRLGTYDKQQKAMLIYANDTIPKRNDLAHVTVKRNGFSRKIFDRSEKELTTKDMRVLRSALLDHHELFEDVLRSLQKEQG